ncbi:unnamed protein product, partial [Candidula unifasciata]
QYNPYHTVSSMTNLLKGWTSNCHDCSKCSHFPPYLPLPAIFLSPLAQHQLHAQPPSVSSSSSSLTSPAGMTEVRSQAVSVVASQPNLATLFRAAVMKSKRSQSWSESYDDFKVIEEKDPREKEIEKERRQHHSNSKMLDPELKLQHEQMKQAYAEILFKWGLLNERTQVLKYTDITEADSSIIEFPVTCCNCSEEVRGVQCNRCRYPALRCSICHIGVRGTANLCLACGHGGHTAHMMIWFTSYTVCPTGCGCSCLQENTL